MKLATNEIVNQLLDSYEKLLTKAQLEIMELYYREDWSLQEIAEKLKVTRTSVHTTIKRVNQTLVEYEAKLGLVKKDQKINDILENGHVWPQIEVLKDHANAGADPLYLAWIGGRSASVSQCLDSDYFSIDSYGSGIWLLEEVDAA